MTPIGIFFGFVELEGNLGLWAQTTNSSGVPTAPDAAPTYSIYEIGVSTPMTNANDVSMTGPVDSKTGFYRATHACTAANGFAAGATYSVLMEAVVSTNAWVQLGTFTVT